MQVLYNLEQFPKTDSPVSLTIGSFDGVHIGHQALLRSLKGTSVVVTFTNHPSEILATSPSPQLASFSQKIDFLKKQGVAITIALAFTKAFSPQTAREFLTFLKEKIPFTRLVLGHDAVMGNKREGNAALIEKLSQELNFRFESFPAQKENGVIVSSSLIRSLISEGEFEQAAFFLGRPYSIRSLVFSKERHMELDGRGFCLPPDGEYQVNLLANEKTFPIQAKLRSSIFTFSLESSIQGTVDLFFMT